MLQIRSDAPAAAPELSLSTTPNCRHVIVSDSESDSDLELDLQSDDDTELRQVVKFGPRYATLKMHIWCESTSCNYLLE